MKAPLSWLKDYVDIDVSPEELKDKLFSCGFEVEELVYAGAEIDRCVVGKIARIVPHPDSDHLLVCTLDCGEYGRELQIVTGAHNVHEGDLVPVALDGSSLHGGVKIKKGKLRGVESCGMLCSGEELGINDDWYEGADVNGILLLQGEIPVGTDIKKVVGLDDYIFDIAVTSNRPDCQSIYGIAREVAAVLKKPLAPLDLTYTAGQATTSERVRVSVLAPDLCPRYIAHRVTDLKIEKSPQWLRRRLALCGLRAIDNVVDITNFILLELGQPMHAFDLAKVGGGQIVVRRAEEGETITTLDEKQFKLHPENLVICDAEKPVALAGVMGGLNSGIAEDTKEVLFESAKFERANIRRTSRALGQKSDSSARFEKGVDAYTTGIAINRALHLICALRCGTVASDRWDVVAVQDEKALHKAVGAANALLGLDIGGADVAAVHEKMSVCGAAGSALAVANPTVVRTSVSAINGLLGIEISKEEIKDILTRLNFSVTTRGDALTVTAPAYREDIEGFPDLAEEVIRMHGYDSIEGTFLQKASVTNGGLNAAQRAEERAKAAMRGQDFAEIITYSFISPKDYELLRLQGEAEKTIRIKNPIGEDMSIMRTTLASSMLSALERNIRRGNEAARLYELANVYLARQLPLSELPEERKTLSVGVYGAGEDFFSAKGAFEALAAAFGVRFAYAPAQKPFLHPGKTAEILLEGEAVGYLGELAPDLAEKLSVETRVYLGELNYAALAARADGAVHYKPLPRFPEVRRDLALVAEEEVSCAAVEQVIAESCKYVTAVHLFDVYRGEQIGAGKKSMAFSVTFTPRDKAIAPEDADGYVKRILKSLREKVGAELR